ncbi:MAG: organomercurial lyase [Actinomycetia bacterium]|nr:organomercurial lyase [Actinomycetes bacterium]
MMMGAIEEVRKHIDTPPDVTAVRSAGFRLLLRTGEPVTRADWASEAGISDADLQTILERTVARGRVELAEDGSLIGVAGLTVRRTPHRVEIDGATRYTWCALDAVGILGALGVDAAIHSTDPASGEPVVIPFVGGIPSGGASLFILGGYDGGDVVDDWCPLVNFFTSEAAAEEWVAQRDLDGDVVSVVDIAADTASMWRPVVGPQPLQGS